MLFDSISIIILILLVSAFIHIIPNNSGDAFLDAINSAYVDASSSFNGGFFGAIFGWLFLTMGKAPAIITDLILFIVDVLLLTKTTVNQLTKPVKKAYDRYEVRREERMIERNPADFDVPLDEYPPNSKKNNKKLDVINDEKPKKTRKKAEQATNSNLDDDDMSKLINEINEATKRTQQNREKSKTLDDIISDTNENEEKKAKKAPKKENKEEDKFEVENGSLSPQVQEYTLPPVDILVPAKKASVKDVSSELKENAETLIETLTSFKVNAEIIDISRGPSVTRYELKPASGIKISKITSLADDIALNLAATNVRIEAPIPGKAAVGIEVPNKVKTSVSMREIIDTDEFESQKSILSAGLGKDIAGKTVFCNIDEMPHLLIAGTTGSGKSVCMNSIIVSILYRAKPDEVKFLMIDPKKVEFTKYENIPHLLVPVVTDPRKASGALGWAVSEMLKRYQLFSEYGVRDITGYNKLAKKKDMDLMHKIVICIDELADLMMASPKEVEDSICRLAQMARAAGMHLVIATQRPSVDVITGLIKANISSRIALTVSSQIDSRTILDSGGAEKLLGRGDMLYSPIGASKPLRVQGCFISDEEVEELCDFIRKQDNKEDIEAQKQTDEIMKEIENKTPQEKGSNMFDESEGAEELDSLFEKAVEVVLDSGRASTSFLQRKLGVGYSRGSKIMDQLEEKGIIGAQDGAKPREIKMSKQMWYQLQAQGGAPSGNPLEQIDFDNAEISDNSDVFDEE